MDEKNQDNKQMTPEEIEYYLSWYPEMAKQMIQDGYKAEYIAEQIRAFG